MNTPPGHSVDLSAGPPQPVARFYSGYETPQGKAHQESVVYRVRMLDMCGDWYYALVCHTKAEEVRMLPNQQGW